MDYKTLGYLLYLAISIGLTLGVARVLFKNGRVFLIEVFKGNSELTDAVNKLLLVGFLLLNLGYITLTLKTSGDLTTDTLLVEFLSAKIGFIVIVLGLMHFLNLYIFFRLRRKARQEASYPDYTLAD